VASEELSSLQMANKQGWKKPRTDVKNTTCMYALVGWIKI